MSSVEAFRFRLFAPNAVVSAEELLERIVSATTKVRKILRPFVDEQRVAFETPIDGEGWLVVLVREETQMRLQFAITEKAEVMRRMEAAAAATVFRKHCETLISVIRRSRIDRQNIDDLHKQAVKAHQELADLSAKDEGQALRTLIRMPNSCIWSPDVPLAPAHLRAHAELQTITFAVESVGQDFAIVLLDKGSRRVLSADRARTRMSWKPLEQPRNTSTWLHRKMLRNADVKADCSCILNKNGQLHGIALHSIAKDI